MSQYEQQAATPDAMAPEPVAESERLASLDLIRGVAILGILLVNIFFFGLPGASFSSPHVWGGATGLDNVAFAFVYLFAEGKFYPIFSMLFGAGMVMFTDRLVARGQPSHYYLVRIAVLGIVGAIHGLLIWSGDILLPYAVSGAILFLCRNLPAAFFKWTGFALVLFSCLLMLAAGALGTMYQQPDSVPADLGMIDQFRGKPFEDNYLAWATKYGQPDSLAVQTLLYREGGYLEITALRATEYMFFLMAYACFIGWSVLGFMMIGVWLMKSGYFAPGGVSDKVLVVIMMTSLPLAVPMLALTGWSVMSSSSIHFYSSGINGIAAIALIAFYVSMLLLIARRPAALRLAHPISCAGRMAFTNYLADSVVMTLIFYSYGLGLFAEFHYATLLLFVLGMWIFQLIASTLWLRFFRMGPLEWLWRWATYGHRTPLRRR